MQRYHLQPKYYSLQDIQLWQKNLVELPTQISAYEQQIFAAQATNNKVRQALQQHEDLLIKPIIEDILLHECFLDALTLPEKITARRAYLDHLIPRLNVLNTQINHAEQHLRTLTTQLDRLQIIFKINFIKQENHELKRQLLIDQQNLSQESALIHKIKSELQQLNIQICELDYQVNRLSVESTIDDMYHYQRFTNNDYYSSGMLHNLTDTLRNINFNNTQDQLCHLRQHQFRLQCELADHQDTINRLDASIAQRNKKLNDNRQWLASSDANALAQADTYEQRSLQQELDKQAKALNNHKHQKFLLDGQKHQKKIEINDAQKQLSAFEKKLGRATDIIGQRISPMSAINLEQHLLTQRQKLKTLQIEADKLKADVAAGKEKMNQLHRMKQGAISTLTQHQNNAFLIDLQQQPKKLVDELHSQISALIRQYDANYPDQQTKATRLALLLFEKNLHHLRETQLPPGSENLNYQNEYYRICGLLWQKYRELQIKPEDSRLAQQLLSLLDRHPIAPQDANSYYQEFLEVHAEWQEPALPNSLHKQEQCLYLEAINELHQTISNADAMTESRKLLTCAQALLTAIQNYAHDKLPDQFDIKFYTLILKASNARLKHKLYGVETTETPARYHELLTKMQASQGSKCRKISGVLMTLFGLSGITLSFAEPNLAHASPQVKYTTSAISLGTVIGGIGLFRCGCYKDTAKAMSNFDNLLNKNNSLRQIP